MKVLIYIETKEGSPIGTSLELFSAAAALGADADAVLVGENMEEAAKAAAAVGGNAICYVEGPADATEDYITDAVAQVANAGGYDAVLFSATSVGKVVTPRVAARIGAGSVNDAIGLAVDGGKIVATRNAFGGTALQDIRIEAAKAAISVRGGSFAKPEEGPASPAAPVKADITVADDALRSKITEVIAEAGEVVNLVDANVIVSGGRGMGSEEDFQLCKQLADVLGGVVGASRPVIENEWIGRTHQVGQSGVIVAPDLYFACGISGATQHVSGMMGSKFIVAINKDEDAPIFSIADVGIVGDVKVIMPLLIEEIKKKKAEG